MVSNASGSGVTDRQMRLDRFVAVYLSTNSVSKAAEVMGDPGNRCGAGSRALHEPYVQAELARKLGPKFEAANVTSERVISELAAIAFGDIRDLYDDKGFLRPVSDWPGDVAASIASVEVEARFEGRGEDRVELDPVVKVRRLDKIAALKLLGQHLKMFRDTVELTVSEDLGDRLLRLRQKVGDL